MEMNFKNLDLESPEPYYLQITGMIEQKIRDREIRRICTTYADGTEGELICLFGSSGYLEFSVNKGSANKSHNLEEGGEFILKIL